jgi:hypothetical protein
MKFGRMRTWLPVQQGGLCQYASSNFVRAALVTKGAVGTRLGACSDDHDAF